MTKHIILTRLGIKWRYTETNLSWEEWYKNSIYLMDTFCRPSLKNQSNQNFTLLTFVDKSVNYYGDTLENEIILKVDKTNEMIGEINKYLSNLKDFDTVICTRLDRDDSLHYNFINIVQKELLGKEFEQYIDLKYVLTYDNNTKNTHQSNQYNIKTSPFVSTYEFIKNGKIRCIPFAFTHTRVSQALPGKKLDELLALQVIHNYNLINKTHGNIIQINKNDYGI